MAQNDIDIAGAILKARESGSGDETIISQMQTKGYSQQDVQQAMQAIDKDEIYSCNSLWFLTPVSPINYTIGAKKMSIRKNIIWGLFKHDDEIGIRTIDNVQVEEHLIGAHITVTHSDETEIAISAISKAEAHIIEKLFGYIIESQRMKVINIGQD